MTIAVRKTILSLSALSLLLFLILQQWEDEESLQDVAQKRVRTKKRHSSRHYVNSKSFTRNGTVDNDVASSDELDTQRDADTVSGGAPEDTCARVCLEQRHEHYERWGGDLLNITDVGRLVQEARREFEAKLKMDYGEENYVNIFTANGTSRGRRVILPGSGLINGPSTQRFKRKLKLKILGMQQVLRKSLNEADGECTCGGSDGGEETENSRTRRLVSSDGDTLPLDKFYERIVWATGGHSAAAGHGNLFNESYTSYLEQAVTPTFAAIGIEFEGRNHAMGGTPSAPEIALCQEAVFGRDADIITYDYGMTDAGYWSKKTMYDERVGLHPNRPALLNINILVEDSEEEQKKLGREEARGLTVLYLNPQEFNSMKSSFPDMFGLNAEQINATAPFARHFKCRTFFEKGDPYCGEKKYDNDLFCPDRGMMADWHPGWKMTALWGNTFAIYLSDMLIDAIEELKSASNQTDLLEQLRKEEDNDYKAFLTSATTKDSTDYHLVPKEAELVNDGTNTSIFFTEPSVCHTARLPSQTRYLGIITETDQIGVHDYFKGISMKAARNITSDENSTIPMPLVYDDDERQKGCDVELNRDYRDYFFASNKMGWTTITIPNDAENRLYVEDSQKLQGVLVFCLVNCPWGNCPPGEMRKEEIFSGQLRFEVDSVPVTNTTNLIDDCLVLRGAQGHHWQPNQHGRYEFRTRVIGNSTEFAYLRISSLVLL